MSEMTELDKREQELKLKQIEGTLQHIEINERTKSIQGRICKEGFSYNTKG
jgi:hypothetical protein